MERSVEETQRTVYTLTEEEFKAKLGITEAENVIRVRTAGFDMPGHIQIILAAIEQV